MQRIHYSQSEHTTDAVVHIIGVTCGIVATGALTLMILERVELTYAAGLGICAFGLLTMFNFSALYNIAREGWRKALFRRLDHAAIFLLIAGTYTPSP